MIDLWIIWKINEVRNNLTVMTFSFVVVTGRLLGNEGAPPPITSMLPESFLPGGGPAFLSPKLMATAAEYLLFSLTEATGINWSFKPVT